MLLFLRPRLVIYNIAREELRPILADLAIDLDEEARWAAAIAWSCQVWACNSTWNARALSQRFVGLGGGVQNHQGWATLEETLETALRGGWKSRATRVDSSC